MISKASRRVQKTMDNILRLKKKLFSWDLLNKNELFDLIKEFEKIPRAEGSDYYNNALNDPDFAKILIKIAKENNDNTKLVLYIISSLGMMNNRYKLPETDEIYSLMLSNKDRKGIGPYVAIYLPGFKRFENFPNKWEYYMKVKDMSPKKVAEQRFLRIIINNLVSIPEECKSEILNFLRSKAQKADSESGAQYYLDLIREIEQL